MYELHQGNCLDILQTLPAASVHCCVTSPPYFGLRDYGVDGQIGMERTVEQYVAAMVDVFRAVRRVLRDDGTLWLNLGDSYANDAKWGGTTGGKHAGGLHGQPLGRNSRDTGLKPKDLIGIPWRVAFALQADGWWLRSDIIWAKPNPMPESVTDRPTKAHEYVFLLAKAERYYYDAEAVREAGKEHAGRADTFARDGAVASHVLPGQHAAEHRSGRTDRVPAGRNKRSVWTVATEPYPDAHFATYPTALVKPCILAGCPAGGAVLDPFAGSGTTLAVARALGRDAIGIELNPAYVELAHRRIGQTQPALIGL